MSMGLKLIQKLARRAKFVKDRVRGFDEQAKSDKLDEVMKDSPRVYHAMIHSQRKADGGANAGFGVDVTTKKPRLEYKAKATIQRFDYGGADYGIRATLAAGLIVDSRVQAGDVVEVLSGNLQGYYLTVVEVTDSTHLRLEDTTAEAYAGTKEQTTVITVDDVTGSLNSTYWLLSKPGTNYYVWYDDGAGVDPAVVGRTAIPVVYSDDDTAATIATLTKAALDAVSGAWTTTQDDDTLTIEDQVVGAATDATDGTAATGFAITVVTQGTAANPTPTAEADKYIRMQLSSEKKNYF